jgi:superfamily II DNA or RNA helicase
MEITDAWLMEMGGWQEMKRAKAMWREGAVVAAAFDGTRLTGTVRDQGKEFACGLLMRSRSDMDNLCTCFQAKRTGSLCAHSLAAGTAWVHRHEKQPVAAGAGAVSSGLPAAAKTAVIPAVAEGPLEFVLAGNFIEGLQRQRLTIAVETGPPNATQQTDDTPVLTWLGTLQQKSVPPHLMLTGTPQITGVFTALTGHPRVFVRDGSRKIPVTVTGEPSKLPLVITGGANGQVRLSLRLPHPNFKIALPATAKETGWIWHAGTASLAPLRLPEPFYELLRTLPPQRPLEKPRRWLAANLEALQDCFDPDTAASAPEVLAFQLRRDNPRFELSLEGSLERLTAKLRCRYEGGPVPFPPLAKEVSGFPLESPEAPHVFRMRNHPAEAAAVRRLEGCGFDVTSAPGEWVLTRENLVLQFFAGELDRLKAEWHVTLGARFSAATANVERVTPQWKPVGSGSDWLAFDLAFASSRGTVLDRVEVARMLAGTGHRKMPNGRIAVVNMEDAMDLNEVLRDVQPDQATGSFRVKRSQLGYLEQTFGTRLEARESTPHWPLDISVPDSLVCILRDYQKTGVQWLLDQSARGMGGILADEMGLGKTLQSLALIAALRRQWPGRPALVVCPKSLTGNWRAEAARFVPDLTCLTLEGARRKNQFAACKDAHLVITSYQLLARDIDQHRTIDWGPVILDEAGFIRNPDTQAAKAARELTSAVRFALTGTPIENGVRDLWSLTEFAVPGYLGPRREFAERYETPLTAGGNAPVMARLRRRMAPFILRRLKSDVAKDLPSKIESVHACELNAVQRDLYASLMREGAAKVMDAESAKNQNQARMHLLTTLLRLRQTCCDPRLLPVELPKQATDEMSGKLEAVAELLEEIRDGGHSVIIFSAFASMLRLLEGTVTAAGLDYCLLDGQTRDRTTLVHSFQNDPDKRVFLISLKAGGCGLNLTKADTVIHFDPWWNPAVEAQATDRAHRIGQSRAVTVYKLITTGTVEEKILRLQQKKRGLMDAALDDEAPLMDGLSDADVRELLHE